MRDLLLESHHRRHIERHARRGDRGLVVLDRLGFFRDEQDNRGLPRRNRMRRHVACEDERSRFHDESSRNADRGYCQLWSCRKELNLRAVLIRRRSETATYGRVRGRRIELLVNGVSSPPPAHPCGPPVAPPAPAPTTRSFLQ